MNQKKIPDDLLELAQSPEIYDACEQIGKEYNLSLEQIGELDAEISNIIVGSSEANEFTSNIASKLMIDPVVARQIASQINTGIIKTLQEKLRQKRTAPVTPNPHATLERVGNFKVEKDGSDEINAPTTTFDQTPLVNTPSFPLEHGSSAGNSDVGAPITEPEHLLGEHGVEPSFPPLPEHAANVVPPPNLPSEVMDIPYFTPMPGTYSPKPAAPTPQSAIPNPKPAPAAIKVDLPKPPTIPVITPVEPPPLEQPQAHSVNLLRQDTVAAPVPKPTPPPVPVDKPIIVSDLETFTAPIMPDPTAPKIKPVSPVPGTPDPYRESAL